MKISVVALTLFLAVLLAQDSSVEARHRGIFRAISRITGRVFRRRPAPAPAKRPPAPPAPAKRPPAPPAPARRPPAPATPVKKPPASRPASRPDRPPPSPPSRPKTDLPRQNIRDKLETNQFDGFIGNVLSQSISTGLGSAMSGMFMMLSQKSANDAQAKIAEQQRATDIELAEKERKLQLLMQERQFLHDKELAANQSQVQEEVEAYQHLTREKDQHAVSFFSPEIMERLPTDLESEALNVELSNNILLRNRAGYLTPEGRAYEGMTSRLLQYQRIENTLDETLENIDNRLLSGEASTFDDVVAHLRHRVATRETVETLEDTLERERFIWDSRRIRQQYNLENAANETANTSRSKRSVDNPPSEGFWGNDTRKIRELECQADALWNEGASSRDIVTFLARQPSVEGLDELRESYASSEAVAAVSDQLDALRRNGASLEKICDFLARQPYVRGLYQLKAHFFSSINFERLRALYAAVDGLRRDGASFPEVMEFLSRQPCMIGLDELKMELFMQAELNNALDSVRLIAARADSTEDQLDQILSEMDETSIDPETRWEHAIEEVLTELRTRLAGVHLFEGPERHKRHTQPQEDEQDDESLDDKLDLSELLRRARRGPSGRVLSLIRFRTALRHSSGGRRGGGLGPVITTHRDRVGPLGTTEGQVGPEGPERHKRHTQPQEDEQDDESLDDKFDETALRRSLFLRRSGRLGPLGTTEGQVGPEGPERG